MLSSKVLLRQRLYRVFGISLLWTRLQKEIIEIRSGLKV